MNEASKSKRESAKQRRHQKRLMKVEARNEMLYKKYGINAEYHSDGISRFLSLQLVIRKRWLLLILLLILAIICSSMFFYFQSLNKTTAVMMLNYEESANGMAPNRTRFDITEFTSDEVMSLALKKAGLEGKTTKEELAAHIGVYSMVNRKPEDESSYYIPTSFKIYYSNFDAASGISSEDMLGIICDAYTEVFHEKYTTRPTVLSDDYAEVHDFEYNEAAAFFKMRIDELYRYLDMRSGESGEYKSSETGETFNSLKKLVVNLRDYTLEDFKAYIWENGIVQDKEIYVNTLEYLNSTYERSRQENNNEYLIRRDVISYYSTPMSTSILIPTNNNNNYYMSRTKTGVDYLATDAQYYLDSAKQLELRITKGQDKLSKIPETAVSASVSKADKMVDTITAELERIEKLAQLTDREYTNEKSKNYLTFQSSSLTVTEIIPIKTVAAISVLFLAFAVFVFYREFRYAVRRLEDR